MYFFKNDNYQTMQLVIFGLDNGAVLHDWFTGLDQVFDNGNEPMDTAVKIFTGISEHTPLLCA